ncbi:MAG: alpha/beta hydrolase, partial [Planctomycetota bacterium]
AAAAGVIAGLEEDGADTAVSSRPDALVLFNPVFDNGPGGWGHNRVKARWREISPLHNITAGAPPTIVFLGSRDKLVPVATAEAYQERMQAVGARCDLHVYEGRGHGFFNRDRSAASYDATVAEMDRFFASLGWL